MRSAPRAFGAGYSVAVGVEPVISARRREKLALRRELMPQLFFWEALVACYAGFASHAESLIAPPQYSPMEDAKLFTGTSKLKWSSSLKKIGFGVKPATLRVSCTSSTQRLGSLTPLPWRKQVVGRADDVFLGDEVAAGGGADEEAVADGRFFSFHALAEFVNAIRHGERPVGGTAALVIHLDEDVAPAIETAIESGSVGSSRHG